MRPGEEGELRFPSTDRNGVSLEEPMKDFSRSFLSKVQDHRCKDAEMQGSRFAVAPSLAVTSSKQMTFVLRSPWDTILIRDS